jgi:transcriptional regulator with XRE-family HTH domain
MSGDEVSRILLDNGFKLKSIAETLNISPQAFSSKLKVKDISLGTLTDIANAINKTIDYFERKNNLESGFQSKGQELIPSAAQIIRFNAGFNVSGDCIGTFTSFSPLILKKIPSLFSRTVDGMKITKRFFI